MTPLQQIILDAVTYAGPADLWPDDPEEEKAHGPTREDYRFGWRP